jgi:hypothetical protein
MTDPERLSSITENEVERLLLQAGRPQAPSGARERAILAATAALGTTGLAAGAAASGVLGKTGTALSLKWLAVMGLLGIGAMAAAVTIETRRPSQASHAAAQEPLVAAPAREGPLGAVPRRAQASGIASAVASSSTSAPSAAPVEARPAVVPPPSTAVDPPAPRDVHAQLQALEQARGALAAGDAPRALSILDAYASAFPHASMAPEATVLRVEALVRAGDTASAERLGSAFLAGQPQSPYAAHVRSLIGRPEP